MIDEIKCTNSHTYNNLFILNVYNKYIDNVVIYRAVTLHALHAGILDSDWLEFSNHIHPRRSWYSAQTD